MTTANTNQDFGGTSALQNAILTESNDKVRQSIASANTINTDVNFLGQSPLHVAVLQEDTVRILLEADHNPNIRDHHGCTPLMYAAAMGRSNVVKMLITYGADLLPVDNLYHQNFIHFAMIRGHHDLVIESLFHIKSKSEGVKGVEWLVSRLAEAAIWSLIFQCRMVSPFATKYFIGLLEFIDDVNFRFRGFVDDAKNSTLLHHVVNYEQAQALIARGFTSFEEQDSKGETPIMNKSMIWDPRWLQLCLKNGANLNHQSTEGETVLSRLMRSFRTEYRRERICSISASFSVALENGADLLLRDNCVCPCAPGGCLPTRVLQVQVTEHWFSFNYPLCNFGLLSSLQEYGRLQDAIEVLLSFIRRSAFEELGLEHVCCMPDPDPYIHSPKLPLEEKEKEEVLKRNEPKIKALEHYMTDLFGITYNQLEQVWLQQLRRSHDRCYDSYLTNWAPKSDKNIMSDQTVLLSLFACSPWRLMLIFLPHRFPSTALMSRMIGLFGGVAEWVFQIQKRFL